MMRFSCLSLFVRLCSDCDSVAKGDGEGQDTNENTENGENQESEGSSDGGGSSEVDTGDSQMTDGGQPR